MSESTAERQPRVVVVPAGEGDASAARKLSREAGLAIAAAQWREIADFALRIDGSVLSLVDRESKDSGGIKAEFPGLRSRGGRRRVSRRDSLGRAFGPRVRTIVDATAGLGHDAFLLARMGFEVTAIERSPVLTAMLRHALNRAKSEGVAASIVARLCVIKGDARNILASMKEKPDAVYLDPMFPPRKKKSALAKKSIRVVRALVGDDADASQMLAVALACAKQRVVVKRLDDAPPLAPDPMAQIEGKTVRYDVYRAAGGPRALR